MRALAGTLIAALVIGSSALAQSPSADEKAIRDLIARYDGGERNMAMKEEVFWSGAIKRPVVGSERGEEIPSGRQPSARVPGSQRSKTTPIRIEVAQSGDMAYEFSNTELSFDLKTGGRESFPTSVLRVWRKDAGQWRIAAMFARPHYQDPTAAAGK